MTAPAGRRVVDGALTDDVTDAARAQYAAGKRVDHDALARQARTALSAQPEHTRHVAWDWFSRESDAELRAMDHIDRDRVEAIAYRERRTYNDVAARRRQLRRDERRFRKLTGADPGPPDG